MGRRIEDFILLVLARLNGVELRNPSLGPCHLEILDAVDHINLNIGYWRSNMELYPAIDKD